MITKMTGTLVRVLDEEIRLAVGPYEYQILITEATRRQLQLRTGEEMTLHISEYLEGGQNASRLIPRKLGFASEDELEFFDLFTTVEKIGVKKALKALARPVREIADAISRQDAKWLTTLPGIGAASAEQIVTTLKRKVTKFALARTRSPAETGDDQAPEPITSPLVEDVYLALMSLGLTPMEARTRLDSLLQAGHTITDVPSAITLIFQRK
jgi:Holliday junction DNA helicase RuvA